MSAKTEVGETPDQLRLKIRLTAAANRLAQGSDADTYVIDDRHTGGREVNLMFDKAASLLRATGAP